MLINPENGIPKRDTSHMYGITSTWEERLKQLPEWDQSLYYFSSGNIFSGISEKVFNRWNEVIQLAKDRQIYIVESPTPIDGYEKRYQSRLDSRSTHWEFAEDTVKEISSTMSTAKLFDPMTFIDMGICDSIMVGDSHSLAYAKSNEAIIRRDAKTLHGARTNGFRNILDIERLRQDDVKSVALCFGSIDVRFHVFRDPKWFHNNSPIFVAGLVSNDLFELEMDLGKHIDWCAPVPVEHEERKMAKTTMFGKRPFYGSVNERRLWTKSFTNELIRLGVRVRKMPEVWYEMDPTAFAEEFMTASTGIHVAPRHYNGRGSLAYKEYNV